MAKDLHFLVMMVTIEILMDAVLIVTYSQDTLAMEVRPTALIFAQYSNPHK